MAPPGTAHQKPGTIGRGHLPLGPMLVRPWRHWSTTWQPHRPRTRQGRHHRPAAHQCPGLLEPVLPLPQLMRSLALVPCKRHEPFRMTEGQKAHLRSSRDRGWNLLLLGSPPRCLGSPRLLPTEQTSIRLAPRMGTNIRQLLPRQRRLASHTLV